MFLPWLVQCIFRGSISAVNGFCHDRPQRRAASLRALNCLTNLRYASFTARSGVFFSIFLLFPHNCTHLLPQRKSPSKIHSLLLETSFPRCHRPGLWQDEKQDEAKKWNFSKCFRTVWSFQASTVQNVKMYLSQIQKYKVRKGKKCLSELLTNPFTLWWLMHFDIKFIEHGWHLLISGFLIKCRPSPILIRDVL